MPLNGNIPVLRQALRLLGPAFLVAMLAFTAAAFVAPRDTFGATSTQRASCGVNLRSSASSSARIRTVIKTGTKVTVVSQVTGSSYRTTCAGRAVSGSTWFRISAINGRTVRALYGVSYLYAARGLFTLVPAPLTRYALCGVNLRSSASLTGVVLKVIPTGTKVTVVSTAPGPSYQTTCANNAVSSSSWYQISAVNGTSVKTLYGVSSVSAAAALFASAAPAVAPTPTPTPTPTPDPEANADADSHAEPDCDSDPHAAAAPRPCSKGSTSAIGSRRSTGRRSRRPARSSSS